MSVKYLRILRVAHVLGECLIADETLVATECDGIGGFAVANVVLGEKTQARPDAEQAQSVEMQTAVSWKKAKRSSRLFERISPLFIESWQCNRGNQTELRTTNANNNLRTRTCNTSMPIPKAPFFGTATMQNSLPISIPIQAAIFFPRKTRKL